MGAESRGANRLSAGDKAKSSWFGLRLTESVFSALKIEWGFWAVFVVLLSGGAVK